MRKNVVTTTLISVILGLAMIGGAIYWQVRGSASDGSGGGGAASGDRSFTSEELARHDGKVLERFDQLRVDVYLIEGFLLWKMGEHVPSGGKARCGLDLTEVIDESPHGRSKLQLLKKVGTLE